MPLHLQPHQELRAIADKLNDASLSSWKAEDKLALLGFVRLHIAHAEMQEAASASTDRTTEKQR